MNLSKELKTSFKRWLQVARTAVAGLAIAILLALLNQDNPGYAGVNPHPYLFISVLIGATLGLRGALMVSPVLTVAYFYFLHQRLDKLAVEYFFSFDNVVLPVSFVLLAAVVGAISGNLRRNIESLAEENDNRKKLISDLEEINESLRHERLGMETKLAVQSQTISRVLEYAKIFDSMEIDKIAQGAVELVCEYLGENSCYLYLLEEDVLRRIAFRDEAEVKLPEEIKTNVLEHYPLIKIALENAQKKTDGTKTAGIESINLKTVGPKDEYHGLCTPIIYGGISTVKTAGVLYMRRMRFANVVASSYLTFDSIGLWIGLSIAKVRHIHHVRELSFVDEITGLFTYSYFQKRIQAEFKKARRHGLKLNILKFSLPDLSNIPTGKRIMLMKLLAHSVDIFRFNCDAVTLTENGAGVYAILSVVDIEDVEDFRKNVLGEFLTIIKSLKEFSDIKLLVSRSELKEGHRNTDDVLKEFKGAKA